MPTPSKMPLIGITTMDDRDAAGVHAPRFSNNQSYSQAIIAAGGVPVLVPHLEEADSLRRIYDMLDGLLLPGGVDMHPRYYGQEPHPALDEVDSGLDHIEITMLAWALEDDMPVLGICRGHQVLNIAMGGTLIQDIYAQYTTVLDHRESAKRRTRDYLAHDIAIDPASRLHAIVGSDRVWVNTSHHQAIDRLAPGLVATAWAPDGIIEAVESPDRRFVLSVQCHPEELWRKHDWARSLFSTFVKAVLDAGGSNEGQRAHGSALGAAETRVARL